MVVETRLDKAITCWNVSAVGPLPWQDFPCRHKLGRQHGFVLRILGLISHTTFFKSFVSAVPCDRRWRAVGSMAKGVMIIGATPCICGTVPGICCPTSCIRGTTRRLYAGPRRIYAVVMMEDRPYSVTS